MKASIYITNLKKYNEGVIDGFWYDLGTLYNEELEELIDSELLQGEDDELFITDTDIDDMEGLIIGAYDNIYVLNDMIQEFNELDNYEHKKVLAILESGYYDMLDEAMDNLDDFELMDDIYSDKDLGQYYADEILEIDELLVGYIDYDKLGRDFGINGALTKYGYLQQV